MVYVLAAATVLALSLVLLLESSPLELLVKGNFFHELLLVIGSYQSN